MSIVYAIIFKNQREPIVAVGTSVINAWKQAEEVLGDPVKILKKMGYRIVDAGIAVHVVPNKKEKAIIKDKVLKAMAWGIKHPELDFEKEMQERINRANPKTNYETGLYDGHRSSLEIYHRVQKNLKKRDRLHGKR